ncbi:MAG: adenosyl-hopene transferase HpnH, partial [Alphaproteobacteria bacterium]|nr:adenosyl-hopene transferase HpnH [Alphaproteobacteria bacterium]
HLDGLEGEHDHAVDQEGVFQRAVSAIRVVKEKGFRVNVNATIFNNAKPDRVAGFMDLVCDDLGVEGVTISPGYAYERAPDQEHFLTRQRTKELFRDILRLGKGKKWRFSQSTLFMDFLAGNQTYLCSPWSNPTRNIFGWQRPCYLLNEGYTKTFTDLMAETAWEQYGVGNYEKCANCMVHSGFEGTAVVDTTKHPLKALRVWLKGIRTEGPMAPDIPLENQRPAEFVFEQLVADELEAAAAHAPQTAVMSGVESSADEAAEGARGTA